jgi:hypothetical protein
MQAIHAKAEAEGYVVKVIELVEGTGRDDYKVLKDLVRTAKVNDILEATDVPMETLAAKSELTSDEAESLMKARIKHFTQSEELTEEDVIRYLDSKTVETVLKVEYLNTYTNAAAADEKQTLRFIQDRDLRDAQVRLMTKLNLDYFLDCMDEVTEEDIEQLAEAARENADDVRALFNINVTKYRKNNTLVKSILKLVGIEAVSTKITRGAKRGQYVLELTADSYIQALIAKREESRTAKRAEEQAEVEAQIERSREMTDEELSTYADMLTALYDSPASASHPVEDSRLDTQPSYELLC